MLLPDEARLAGAERRREGLQFAPAVHALLEFGLRVGEPLERRANRITFLRVEVGAGNRLLQRGNRSLELLDLRRQRVEFALVLVAQLGCRPLPCLLYTSDAADERVRV